MPFDTTFYYNHPHYLNTASIPFMSADVSYPDYNTVKFGSQNVEFSELSTYQSSMCDEETQLAYHRKAEKIMQFRGWDLRNRMNIMMRKPVFGEDTRKAIKIDILFSSLFDSKRFQYMTRYDSKSSTKINDIY